jgi:hypothetical protein
VGWGVHRNASVCIVARSIFPNGMRGCMFFNTYNSRDSDIKFGVEEGCEVTGLDQCILLTLTF